MAHIQVSALIPAPQKQVFESLTDPHRLKDQFTGYLDVDFLSGELPLKVGKKYDFLMSRYGVEQRFIFEVEEFSPGHRLIYRQVEGLFATWFHIIKAENHGQGQTLITDVVRYTLPLGLLGHLADDLYMKAALQRLLNYRLNKAKELFQTQEGAI